MSGRGRSRDRAPKIGRRANCAGEARQDRDGRPRQGEEMKAVRLHEYKTPPSLDEVPDPDLTNPTT